MTTSLVNLSTIEQAVKKLRKFTIQDIAAQTGLSAFDSKRSVESLLKKYLCRVQVTDRGELIYDFGTFVRLNSKTFREQFIAIGRILWKSFTYFFKVWIMLMLLGYFIVFILILLAVAIASMAGDDQDQGISFDSGAFALIFRIFAEFFFWQTITGNLSYQRDRYGYRYRRHEHVTSEIFKSKATGKSKKFISSVFDFVLGPPRAEIHPHENQREVATFIRENKGIISIEEVRALAGWKGRKADEFFTEMITNYEGVIKVSDQGVIYGDFTEFMSGANKEKSTDIVFFWDEFEAEYILTGNANERNMIITGMNLLILLMSYGVLNGRFEIGLYDIQSFQIFFGVIPFVYSTLFFLIPLARSLLNSIRQNRRRLNNIRKRLMKEIYLNARIRISLVRLEEALNASNEFTDKVNEENIKQLMRDEIEDWKGELIVDDKADLVYDFTCLRESQINLKELRTNRQIKVMTGKTVFDTGAD